MALRGRGYFRRLLVGVFAELKRKGIKRVMLFSLPDLTVRAVYEKLHFTLTTSVVPGWFVRSQSHGPSAPFYERPLSDEDAAATAAGYQKATGGCVAAVAAAAPRGRALEAGLADLGRRIGRGGRWGKRAAAPALPR